METTKTLIDRARKARYRASKTVAMARWMDSLREAHRNGAHGDDVTGYWKEQGCPGCCEDVL